MRHNSKTFQVRLFAMTLFAVAVIFMFQSHAGAAGKASGTLVHNGKTYKLSHVIAFTEPNVFEKDKNDVVLILTDQPVAIDSAEEFALNKMADEGKIHGLRVSFDDSQKPYRLVILGGIQVSGSGFMEFEPVEFSATKISGKISKAGGEMMDHKYEFSADFDAPVVDQAAAAKAAEEAGTPLPANGGEPGKAYFEYDKAVRAADVAKMKSFAADEDMAKQLDDPQAKEMISMINELRAKNIKVVKGTINGDNATLHLEGDSSMGGKTTGTAKMVKKNNTWKLIKESWSN